MVCAELFADVAEAVESRDDLLDLRVIHAVAEVAPRDDNDAGVLVGLDEPLQALAADKARRTSH
jgi:hypothetical protein